MTDLKSRIKSHYDVCSTYYHSLWGEHIHHGYFLTSTDTKELAQRQLIELLITQLGSTPPTSAQVLDVGCGIGGTSRYLAREKGWEVTGITLSDEQVKLAYDLSKGEKFGTGSVQFVQLDADSIPSRFPPSSFDIVWICEALSHLPNKPDFFHNAHTVLRPGSRLVIADWVKAPDLTSQQHDADIAPIELGMLLPPLATAGDYVKWATERGFAEISTLDISDKVSKTWDISLSLLSPSLFALAFSMGTDVVNFLRAFQAMRRGFANGSFRYAVLVFEK